MNHATSVRVIAAVAVLALSGQSLSAHDLWIEPAAFQPAAGAIVALRLRVGQDLLGDPLPRDARLIREFIVDDADGRRPVVGRDGADPAGLVRAAAPGLAVVGYHSTPSVVNLTADKFNQYLAEEGLDAVAELRRKAGHDTAAARDAFTRCAKTLLQRGAARPDQHDRAIGLPLELVAERNPYALADGELPVRLTYRGAPLAGALVVALNHRQAGGPQRLRTDRDGRVRVRISQDGLWLIKVVHMVAAPAGSDADWESYWASLTFAAGPAVAAGGSPGTR